MIGDLSMDVSPSLCETILLLKPNSLNLCGQLRLLINANWVNLWVKTNSLFTNLLVKAGSYKVSWLQYAKEINV